MQVFSYGKIFRIHAGETGAASGISLEQNKSRFSASEQSIKPLAFKRRQNAWLFLLFMGKFRKKFSYNEKKRPVKAFALRGKGGKPRVSMAYFTKRVLSMTEKTAGFSRDGTPLLAALTAEKVGAETTVTLLSQNLAPLAEGEYFLTLAGKKMATAALDGNRQPPAFSSERLCLEQGLSALLCFWREGKTVPVAFGKSGKCPFQESDLLQETERFCREKRAQTSGFSAYGGVFSARDGIFGGKFSAKTEDGGATSATQAAQGRGATVAHPSQNAFVEAQAAQGGSLTAVQTAQDENFFSVQPYADEALATENYFEWEKQYEKRQNFGGAYDDPTRGDCQKPQEKTQSIPRQAHENGARLRQKGETAAEVSSALNGTVASGHSVSDANEQSIFAAFENTFFMREKKRLISLLKENEEERSLTLAIPGGYFVHVPCEGGKFFAAGIITTRTAVEAGDIDDLSPSEIVRICFAVPNLGAPPPEPLQKTCFFLPLPSPVGEGWWMVCQSPQTGEVEPVFQI